MSRTFLDLVSEEQLAVVTAAIEAAVAKSFDADYSRVTRAEIRYRFTICERIIRELRGDLKWALPRVLDVMPNYLRAELQGTAWSPDDRAMWMPETQTTPSKE